jgi:signal recognition particle subunit SRP54
MGARSNMVDKIPGMADAMPDGAKIDDRELDRIKAVISSMTEDERRHPERFVITSWEEIVDGGKRKKKRSAYFDQGRIKRVARGSGHKEAEVADLLNRFGTMRQLMQQIGQSSGLLGKIPGRKAEADLRAGALLLLLEGESLDGVGLPPGALSPRVLAYGTRIVQERARPETAAREGDARLRFESAESLSWYPASTRHR